MRWLVYNPAPAGEAGRFWGDTPFCTALADALIRLGEEAAVVRHEDWSDRPAADVVVVLRGKHAWGAPPGPLRVLWHISHPETLNPHEADAFDIVAVASRREAETWQRKLKRTVQTLWQCADTQRFRIQAEKSGEARRDFVFVGNTRSVERAGILWALEMGVPLKIIGRGWGRWLPPGTLVSESIAIEDLAALYGRAKVSLNDHWPEMARRGFVNNRVFDAIACGLPVISDHLDEIDQLFEGAVLTYKNKNQLRICIERVLLEYPQILGRVRRQAERVRALHSFDARASELISWVRGYSSRR